MTRERESCGDCRFYHETSKACRRYPAIVLCVGLKQNPVQPDHLDPQFISIFPSMEEHGWCGEYMPKMESMQ